MTWKTQNPERSWNKAELLKSGSGIWPCSLPDPVLPKTSRLSVNHVTGQIEVETFGYYELPLSKVDSLLITSNRYDPQGRFLGSSSWENTNASAAIIPKLLQAKAGRECFLVNRAEDPTPPGRLRVNRTDLIKGLNKTMVLDLAQNGRILEESWQDVPEASGFSRSTFEYRDDFLAGELPVRTVVRGAAAGAVLSTTETLDYDAAARTLKGRTIDYTGTISTQTWKYGFANPVEVQTALRQTVIVPNPDETKFSSVTRAAGSGEILKRILGLL